MSMSIPLFFRPVTLPDDFDAAYGTLPFAGINPGADVPQVESMDERDVLRRWRDVGWEEEKIPSKVRARACPWMGAEGFVSALALGSWVRGWAP